MILSGKQIESKIKSNEIIIKPFNKKQLNPNSYNIRLDNTLLMYTDTILDMKKPNNTKKVIIPEDGYILEPNRLYLGKTVEYTESLDTVPMIEGRSSCGRLGMFIHVTAGFGDIGFCGYWTLEITVIHPLKIYPFVEVGQLFYHTIEEISEKYNSNKYQNNNGIQSSKMYKDFQKKI